MRRPGAASIASRRDAGARSWRRRARPGPARQPGRTRTFSKSSPRVGGTTRVSMGQSPPYPVFWIPAAIPLTGPVDRISLARAREAYAAGEAAGGRSATGAREYDPERVPERDPINVSDRAEINERQRWFLNRVVEGRCDAREIAAVWDVSLKTARRDIATLKAADLICYVGSPRKGRYRKMTG